ncbi:uncharacterized protein LOC134231314 [Saccostrea cucullata]|uniref:uncharacterized protein LOC134231314 n=1 Tax=Saccostrea cuccullata TaxID=36930 RepID=UPI002ED0EE9F
MDTETAVRPLSFTSIDPEHLDGSSNPVFVKESDFINKGPYQNEQNNTKQTSNHRQQNSGDDNKNVQERRPEIEMEDSPLIYKISDATPIHLTLFFAMQIDRGTPSSLEKWAGFRLKPIH